MLSVDAFREVSKMPPNKANSCGSSAPKSANVSTTSGSCKTKSGKFGGTPIGAAKARKFGEVEGLILHEETAQFIEGLKAQGLTGDALRDELLRWFARRNQE